MNIFDRLAPLTYKRITTKSPKWLNNAIRKLIALKNRALPSITVLNRLTIGYITKNFAT